jgi:hypothetical protein
VEHEPIPIVLEDGLNPMRGLLFGFAISIVLWGVFGGGIWFVLSSAA